jgi:predicted enzyme related to lactoylglutathione lyase
VSEATLQEITKHPHGAFFWAELVTTDVDGAKKFYGELMGWTY